MIINGIEFGPIVPVRLTVRPSRAVAAGACADGFNEVIDACCPDAKGEGLDEEGRYLLTQDPEIPLADMLKAGVSWQYIIWAFRILEDQDAERTLRLFAAACAAEVLPIFEAERHGDNRPRACIEASVGYVNGTVTREQMAAAWDAGAAARSAAWDAAGATRSAAWDAAQAAACAAAEAAAGDAARSAAWDAGAAAWAAAQAAARSAAGERQREILLALVEVTP